MRAVFFGTPEIAVPALRSLAETSTLVGVICQPDRPAGRGLVLHEPAVKRAAAELGIEVLQPGRLKDGALSDWLKSKDLDVAVVLAYGRILPPPVLSAPRGGCINLHASLLPKYRGAAPIQWAILRGERTTGISLMQMDEGLDTGPVYRMRSLDIGPDETAGELAERLAQLAAVVVREDLPRALRGELKAAPQRDDEATYAPPITREHARIDWAESASSIVNRVRAMSPRPGAHTPHRGAVLRVLGARVAGFALELAPGTVRVVGGTRLVVAAGSGAVELVRAQLPGKKPLEATDLINGRALRDGDVLGP